MEDNIGGVAAAQAAGVPCVAFPNENTAGHDFSEADCRSGRSRSTELRGLLDQA